MIYWGLKRYLVTSWRSGYWPLDWSIRILIIYRSKDTAPVHWSEYLISASHENDLLLHVHSRLGGKWSNYIYRWYSVLNCFFPFINPTTIIHRLSLSQFRLNIHYPIPFFHKQVWSFQSLPSPLLLPFQRGLDLRGGTPSLPTRLSSDFRTTFAEEQTIVAWAATTTCGPACASIPKTGVTRCRLLAISASTMVLPGKNV